LRKVYEEWYAIIASALPAAEGRVAELGSGAGFLRDNIPGLISSDLLHLPDISIVLDGCRLPFKKAALRAIVMTNVLHHLYDVQSFFSEAARCVKSGGTIVMVEPWVTSWSQFVYSQLHPEPFELKAIDWHFPHKGPLSGANNALGWIIFKRDRRRFERSYPEWHIQNIRPFMPFRYLLSGGVSNRSLMPGFMFNASRLMENILSPWFDRLAMFAVIRLVRTWH
jgi:SAM-dependent methyltransferase|tara:strand:+ start:26040 stop:26711 length:672 start_codon:yes stop_codon:yes gene_type:complete